MLAQFLITRKRTGDPIGQVTAYNANLRNRSVYFGMLIDPALMGAGWTSEAGALFLNYLFTIWDFRKIYIETIDFNFSNFASGIGRFFQEEGCLKENDFFNGRYWDMHILALYRRDWERVAAKYLSQLPVDESSPTSSPADVGA